jgi:predicted transcriptional regulator
VSITAVTVLVRLVVELPDDEAEADRAADTLSEGIEDAISGVLGVYDESVSVIDWTTPEEEPA